MTSKKILSEQFIEYYKLIESLNKTDEKIRLKMLEIVKFHDPFAKTIEFYSFIKENKTIKIIFKYNYFNFIDFSEYIIPIEWLDLKKNEIKKNYKSRTRRGKKEEERRGR